MHSIARRALFLLLLVCTLPLLAQEPDSAKLFDDARQQIADIRKQLAAGDSDEHRLDESKFGAFRDIAAALSAQAEALIGDRQPKLDALEARQNELGPAPAKGTSEAPDIAAQRSDIDKQRGQLDAEIKRAKLLAVDSQQLAGEIAEARRANFQATLSQRTPSPLSPAYWRQASGSLDADGSRLVGLRDGVATALKDSFADDNRAFAIGGLAIGLFLIVFGRWWAERTLMRVTADRVPQGRLRRSALAFAVVVVATAFNGVGAQLIVFGLDWHGAFSDMERSFAHTLVIAVAFGSFVSGLGRALLSAQRPSWRLPPISDAVAQRLRRFPVLLGSAVAFSLLQRQINTLVGASLSATITGTLIVALLFSLLIGWGLTRLRAHEDDASTPHKRSALVGLGIAALWIGVVASLVAVLIGYVALGHQIARQMVGLGMLAATFYLVVHLIEDICATVLSARASWAQNALGLEPRVLDQFAVLCSGAFRVCALAVALFAALRPFGTDPTELVAPVGRVGAGLKIGQIELTPSALIGAVLVFVLGLAAIRAVQRWLFDKYLPTTKLDPGMRSSVTTLLGYVGGVVVFAFALSALGLSIERIAWVASALSVGIGFGLQAVVQNFVSGLILLIERPVKVGDWVVLGDAEGDIRRINVRATEIQTADRATVIVPNSELITKSVRNVTLANAEGRVRVRIPLPIGSDAERVRDLIRASLDAHGGVLATPAPSVLLDSIEGGSLIFIAIAYIGNPRQVGSIRSELLFDMLARLRADNIALAAPYDVNIAGSPAMQASVRDSGMGNRE